MIVMGIDRKTINMCGTHQNDTLNDVVMKPCSATAFADQRPKRLDRPARLTCPDMRKRGVVLLRKRYTQRVAVSGCSP